MKILYKSYRQPNRSLKFQPLSQPPY